jgi:hypothetical protein
VLHATVKSEEQHARGPCHFNHRILIDPGLDSVVNARWCCLDKLTAERLEAELVMPHSVPAYHDGDMLHVNFLSCSTQCDIAVRTHCIN